MHNETTLDLLSLRDPTQCLKPSEAAIHLLCKEEGDNLVTSKPITGVQTVFKQRSENCSLVYIIAELLCLPGLFFFYNQVKWSFAVLFVQSNQVEMGYRSVKEKEARIR